MQKWMSALGRKRTWGVIIRRQDQSETARERSSYGYDAQGGIVTRLDVKSEVLTWPSGLPSSSMSTLAQPPDCSRILTLAFRGTLLLDLQF